MHISKESPTPQTCTPHTLPSGARAQRPAAALRPPLTATGKAGVADPASPAPRHFRDQGLGAARAAPALPAPRSRPAAACYRQSPPGSLQSASGTRTPPPRPPSLSGLPTARTVTSELPRGPPHAPPLHPGERRPTAGCGVTSRAPLRAACKCAPSPSASQQRRRYLLHGLPLGPGVGSTRAEACVCPVSRRSPHSREVAFGDRPP